MPIDKVQTNPIYFIALDLAQLLQQFVFIHYNQTQYWNQFPVFASNRSSSQSAHLTALAIKSARYFELYSGVLEW
jgi:hypothetical protein